MNIYIRTLFVIVFIVFVAGDNFAQSSSEDRPFINPIPVPGSYQNAVDRGTRSADGRPGENYWQQFAEYDVKATLIPEQNKIDGVVRIVYKNNSPDTLTSLQLDLDMNMHKAGSIRIEEAEVTEGVTLGEIRVNGQVLSAERGSGPWYLVRGTRLTLVPGVGVVPDSETEIEVNFTLDIPQAGAGGRMGYDSGNLFFLAYWYPRMAVYDDIIGWHPDPFLSLAEFYHGFGNYNIEITAPGEWVIMSTGDLLNADEVLSPIVLERYLLAGESDEKVQIITESEFGTAATVAEGEEPLTWKFYAENVRDIAFSATRESYWDGARASLGDQNGDGVEEFIRINAFWRSDAPFWAESVAYSQHSITFLSEYTGFAYPWPHMTAVEAGNIIGGGMEFPMMTIIGDYNTRGASALYSVTLHEIAHMWVPMIVSTDERRYSWIDEGYTVYHTDAGKMEYHPDVDHRELTRQSYIRFALSGGEGEMMRWSDFHYTTGAFRIASYQKPATILNALRGVLGEETFYEVHRELFQTWGFKLMSPYDWFSFVESVSGQDLTWFWRAWYFETWQMDQAIDTVINRRNTTEITIRDLGDAPMPIHLLITLEDGEEIKHIEPVDVWLPNNRVAEIVIDRGDVVRVEIDAKRHFPDVDRSNNIWAP